MRGVVVDSSAIVAMVLAEPSAAVLVNRVAGAEYHLLSAGSLVELSIVVESRQGLAGLALVDEILRDSSIEVVDVDEVMARRAIAAWRRFGRGQHRARLNFGDCFVYALAESTGYPILCLGNDFAQTDIEVVALD